MAQKFKQFPLFSVVGHFQKNCKWKRLDMNNIKLLSVPVCRDEANHSVVIVRPKEVAWSTVQFGSFEKIPNYSAQILCSKLRQNVNI